jgi:hypothetical protein
LQLESDISWIITLLCGETVERFAFKVDANKLPGDCAVYPMEPENRAAIHAMLPNYMKRRGVKIIAFDRIDGVFDTTLEDWRC